MKTTNVEKFGDGFTTPYLELVSDLTQGHQERTDDAKQVAKRVIKL